MGSLNKKTCFVIIGYGEKIDLQTGRKLNLDSVYENIIKPVFDSFTDPEFDCFRACDKNYGGVIDLQMYKWIFEADFVVADISTLNPNAIYELGIRHALKPFSTIVIVEDGLKEFPFNINHVKIEKYKHLGDDIGVAEARRITSSLKVIVQHMLDKKLCDSPVYTFMSELKPPFIEKLNEDKELTNKEKKQPVKNEFLEKNEVSQDVDKISLTGLILKAEKAKNNRMYSEALALYKQAELRDKSNEYLKHKIIMLTYKSEIPDKESALNEAAVLLEKSFNINVSINPKTLELGGVIFKKLAELEYERDSINSYTGSYSLILKSLRAYEKAFILSKNYFVGGSYANVLLIASLLEKDLKKKFYLFTNSISVWQRIYDQTTGILNKSGTYVKGNKNRKRTLLEKRLQAMLVLNNGKTNLEIEKVYSELEEIQSEYEKKEFSERNQKSIKYSNLIRLMLKDYLIDINKL